jgi:hypothetical protein
VGEGQPTTLGACLTDEVVSGTRIKKNDNGCPFKENIPARTCSSSETSYRVV